MMTSTEVELHKGPTIPELLSLADRVAHTAMVPKAYRGKPDEILACMAYGAEIGLPPMQALQLIDVIEGRPSLNAQGQRAKALEAGHRLWVEQVDAERAVVKVQRRGEADVHTVTFTMDEAKAAGLDRKSNWQKGRADMLVARATTRACRWFLADVFLGVSYDLDEIPAETPQVPAEPVPMSAENVARFLQACEAQGVDPAEAVEIATAGRTRDPHEVLTSEVRALRDAVTTLAARADETVVEAEVVEEGEPDPRPLTDNQRRKIMALLGDLGVKDRAERLSTVAGIVGHDVESTSALTVTEAAAVIDGLEAAVAAANGTLGVA